MLIWILSYPQLCVGIDEIPDWSRELRYLFKCFAKYLALPGSLECRNFLGNSMQLRPQFVNNVQQSGDVFDADANVTRARVMRQRMLDLVVSREPSAKQGSILLNVVRFYVEVRPITFQYVERSFLL
ncbi:hypothetical protein WK72_15305 [Burkholderia ubonensis]|nr:hypothetical protein WK72_15305 [Burkholderia ubonensis]KWH19968.1 hypothetical protein WL97_00400 [Burkholderia ubonensis]